MKLKSLVAVDLETTSLNFPRITEIAMCAVQIEHLDGPDLPRVVHQLSLCVNPMGKIEPVVADITGLDNFMLSSVNPLNDNSIDCISSFVNNLPHPLCFVAHNGIKFDFPILKKEIFSKTNLTNQNQVFYIDSMSAFREILSKKVLLQSEKVPTELMDTTEDKMCLLGLEEVEKIEATQMTPVKVVDEYNISSTPEEDKIVIDEELMRAPKKPKRQYARLCSGPAQRVLNFNVSENQQHVSTESVAKTCKTSPKTYRLGDIYQFLVGAPMTDSHQAMGDCKALLRCICLTRGPFLDYAERNSSQFFDLDQY